MSPRSAYGDINQRTAAWAATEMLAHAEPIIVLSKFGQTKPLPKNKAKSVKFRRPIPFTINTSQIQEGVTPPSHQMTYEDVPATMGQYGDICEITDQVQDMSEDPVLQDASELSGEQAAETIEMLTYGVIKAGTSVYFSNGAARGDVNTPISLNDFRMATRYLKGQRGKAVTKMMSGSVNYETRPIEGGFIAFGHTDLEADIRNINGFIPVANYGSRQPLCPEELGTIEGIRIILSPLFVSWPDAGDTKGTMYSTTGTDADVYPLIVIAKEAYGLVPLKGKEAIKPMVLNPGTPSKSDPLGQRGYVSWKAYFVAVILNDAWMTRIECAVTALP